ncbi:hypothetical protein QBC39DRAFT_261118, partial [Podospora conica]
KKDKILSIRYTASLFKVGKTQVGAYFKSLRDRGVPVYGTKVMGRLIAVSAAEDAALEVYALWLIKSGSFTAKDLLESAANRLRSRRDPPAPPVSEHWFRR